MRILQGITSIDASDVMPNLGGLYQYPYSISLRNDDCTATGKIVFQQTPFIVLEIVQKQSGTYMRILTTTGEIGVVSYNKKFLTKCSC